ncbi:MAG: DoxX family protein [Burkholderiales bacterium]|nr:DoxX family protein [Anaerolineae bacterium]
MNIALWIVQVLLALAFGFAGFMKLTQSKEKLAVQMAWVEDFSPTIVRLIGLVEILAAVGLVLPALTGILPWLTPVAAVGLVLNMIGAAITHLRRKENPMIVANLVLLALSAFVAYGRWFIEPL